MRLVYVAKTKISCKVIATSVCAFVVAYAKIRFSHDLVDLILNFP